MEKNASIFISGHRGLVGSALVRKLVSLGYHNLLLKTHSELELADQTQVEAFFAENKPEYVIHAAGKVGGIYANNAYPAQFIYQNLACAINVIHCAYRYGTKKLLFLGSSCIYPKLAPQPIKEEFLLTGLLEPTNEPYALAKIAGLKMAEYYRKEYGCDFISAIPNNLYGINDHFHPQNSHVLPALLRKMHLAKCMQNNDISAIRRDLARDYPITSNEDMEAILAEFGIERRENVVVLKLWGSGSPFREFMFADDLADALIFLMAHYSASAPVNIGTGHDISIYDLAMLVRQTVDFAGEILWDSSKPDGTPRKQLDITKLSELGFRATTPLSEGLSKTYEWYKETL